MPLLSVDWHFCHLAAIEVIFGGSGGFADDDLLIDDEGGGVVYFLWSSFLHLLGCVACVISLSHYTTQRESCRVQAPARLHFLSGHLRLIISN